ncbi:MAG: cupin domain-containing protein [Roseiflexaceae bacterium]
MTIVGQKTEDGMTIVINKLDLPSNDIGWEFQGAQYADTNVSFLIIDAPPGSGPALHSHPYEEIFIVQEGQATLTVGDATIEATSGQIVIVPAGVPHKFVNSGNGPLRQLDIHASRSMITTWL